MDQTADANRRWYANHDPELYDAIDRDWDKGRQLQQTGREKAETSRNRANDVMKSFLNAKSNRDNAQKSLDSTLPSIANRASEGAKGFINSAGKWVSNAAGDVGKAASDAAGWLGDRAGDVGKAATNAWNDVTGAANQAGNWIGDRASDVGDWLGGRAGDVGKAATNAWEGAKGAANDVRDFFVGNPDQQNASRMMRNPERSNQGGVLGAAGQWISDRAGDVAGAATNAWNGVTGAVGDAGQWIGDRAGDVAGAASQAGQWIGDTAQKAWESPWVNPVKAINVAGDWIGDRAGDVAGAANTAWNGVRGAANSVGDWIGNAPKNVANWYTGDPELEKADELTRSGNLDQEWGRTMQDYASHHNYADENQMFKDFDTGTAAYLEGGKKLRDAEQHYDNYQNAPRQAINRGLNSAGQWIGDRVGDVGKAAGAVGDWVGDRVDDANYAITQRARQQASNELSENIKNAYERVAEKYGVDPNQHPVLWNNGAALNAIENELNKAYGDYDKRIKEIERNPIGNAVGSIFHSAIDDKPDGVTDTFWKNYVASGGTREQYERDWR